MARRCPHPLQSPQQPSHPSKSPRDCTMYLKSLSDQLISLYSVTLFIGLAQDFKKDQKVAALKIVQSRGLLRPENVQAVMQEMVESKILKRSVQLDAQNECQHHRQLLQAPVKRNQTPVVKLVLEPALLYLVRINKVSQVTV